MARICPSPPEIGSITLIRSFRSPAAYPEIGREEIGISHCGATTWYAFAPECRVAVDAELPLEGEKGKGASRLFARIWGDAERFERLSPGQLGRLWTVCEALLKLAGTGWDRNAASILAPVDSAARSGSLALHGMPVSWRAFPVARLWVCIAVEAAQMPPVFFRPALA